jgi:hypothetical protein
LPPALFFGKRKRLCLNFHVARPLQNGSARCPLTIRKLYDNHSWRTIADCGAKSNRSAAKKAESGGARVGARPAGARAVRMLYTGPPVLMSHSAGAEHSSLPRLEKDRAGAPFDGSEGLPGGRRYRVCLLPPTNVLFTACVSTP